MLSVAEPFLEQQMHPTTIISAYRQALDDIVSITRDKIRFVCLNDSCDQFYECFAVCTLVLKLTQVIVKNC